VVKKNPSKAERRKALERAANTIRNYILGADSGVVRGYYTQREFGQMYDMVEKLDKIIMKMK
jgi:hypothetical protein